MIPVTSRDVVNVAITWLNLQFGWWEAAVVFALLVGWFYGKKFERDVSIAFDLAGRKLAKENHEQGGR